MTGDLRLLPVALITWGLGACGPAGNINQKPQTGSPANQTAEGSSGSATSSSSISAHPTYLGGPVLQNAKVVAVYWNANVSYRSELEAFYRVITRSEYFTALAEYGTSSPQQTIGPGILLATATSAGALPGNLVQNEDIHRELSRLIANEAVPKNDPDTVYMIHFPAGVSIEFDRGRSCIDFCAYHSTFQRNRTNVYYAVIPDMSGACSSACGPSSQLGNTTAVASHELAESVTDPAVGLAADYGPPLGWYDREAGEIADICNGERSTVTGFTVQPVWSNALHRCGTF